MKKDNSKILAIVLATLAIIAIMFSLFYKPSSKTKAKIEIVTNPSEFYTVNSCLYRTITYILNDDRDSLLKVLDDSYKKKEKVTEENVIGKMPNTLENSTFVSKKMYYEKISSNVKKYYVYGVIEENTLHDYDIVEETDKTEAYFIVKLDSSANTFSVEPYDGKIFMDGETDEK